MWKIRKSDLCCFEATQAGMERDGESFFLTNFPNEVIVDSCFFLPDRKRSASESEAEFFFM